MLKGRAEDVRIPGLLGRGPPVRLRMLASWRWWLCNMANTAFTHHLRHSGCSCPNAYPNVMQLCCVRTLRALGAPEPQLAGMCRVQHCFFGMPLLCINLSPVRTLYPRPHHLCSCAPPNFAAPHLLHTPAQQHPRASCTSIRSTLVQSGA